MDRQRGAAWKSALAALAKRRRDEGLDEELIDQLDLRVGHAQGYGPGSRARGGQRRRALHAPWSGPFDYLLERPGNCRVLVCA